MPHLDAGVLHELLDGEIPSMELPPIQAHLAACAECRARLDRERELVANVDDLIDTVEVPDQAIAPARVEAGNRAATWRRGLAWAATVIIAAGLGYIAHGANAPQAKQQQVAVMPSPPAAAAEAKSQPESTVAAAPSPNRTAKPAAITALPPANQSPTRRMDSVTRDSTSPAATGVSGVAAAPSAQPAAKSSAGNALEPSSRVAADVRPVPTTQRLAPRDAPGTGALLGQRNALMSRSADTTTVPIQPISLADAIRRLGGTIRLIDGLVPDRLEFRAPYVRVVYPTTQGDLVLQQQLIDGRVVFGLVAPRGFSADSLGKLRDRVRE